MIKSAKVISRAWQRGLLNCKVFVGGGGGGGGKAGVLTRKQEGTLASESSEEEEEADVMDGAESRGGAGGTREAGLLLV